MKPVTLTSATLSIIPFLMLGNANAVEITSISVGSIEKSHFCKSLGGSGKDPVVTIKHAKGSSDKITVKMRDFLSDGRTFNHKTKKVNADPSGTTIVREDFLPPCNTTNGRVNSDYWFIATSKGSKEVKQRWFRYDSAKKKIR